MILLNGKLTIQDALEKILTENKNILNNAQATMASLTNLVAPKYMIDLYTISIALFKGNIGEFLMTADNADKETREKRKSEAVLRLTTTPIHMQAQIAEFVVQTLTDSMGWNSQPEQSQEQVFELEKALRCIPVIEKKAISKQSDIEAITSDLSNSQVKKVEKNDATKSNQQSTNANYTKSNNSRSFEGKLTIQDALEKILTENKNILNNAQATMASLTNLVAPKYMIDLYTISIALFKGNIGEFLMTADNADKETREKRKSEAVLRLTTTPIHMQAQIAEFVVQTLTDSMGWNSQPVNVPSNKSAWRIALAVWVIVVFLYAYLNSLTHLLEESQNDLYNNEALLNGHADIDKNLGFGSKEYYSEKPFAILSTSNSTENILPTSEILPIHFIVQQAASASYYSSSNDIAVEWLSEQFDDNDTASCMVSSTEKKGYYNVHFINNLNNDSFDVLVIVR